MSCWSARELLAELGDGLLVGGDPGGGDRGQLLGGVDLELLEHQVVGDRGRLGLEVGDGVGSGGAQRGPEREGGEDHEHGEAQDPERSTGRPGGVWPRQRGRTGAQHKTDQFTARAGAGPAGPRAQVRGSWHGGFVGQGNVRRRWRER